MDYIDLLKESPDEKDIRAKIGEKEDEFEKTDAYIQHKAIIDALYDDLGKARMERIKKAQEERQKKTPVKRNDISSEEFRERVKKSRDERESALSQPVYDLLSAYKSLTDEQKRILHSSISPYIPNIDIKRAETPITTEQDVDDLQLLLVQTVLDFINDRGLTDIYSVSFSADDLQTSAKHGEWCPATDSHIAVEGLDEDSEWASRVLIGENF